MDAFSHVLLAFILGQALRLDGNLQLILVISSISLDIDAISVRSREAAFRSHRGPVHSLLVALLVSAIISLGYAIFVRLPTTELPSAVLVCLTGALSHLILDFLTTGNMTALWPISGRNFALNLTYYVDPTNLGALIIAAIITIWRKTDVNASQIVAAAAIAFLTVSFGARSYMKHAATKIIKRLCAGVSSSVITSFPTFRPDRWWAVRKTPFENGYCYEKYRIDSIQGKILSKGTVESPYVSYSGPFEPPIDSPQKAVACSKKDKRISKSIQKFILPAVDVASSNDGGTWQAFWYDAFTLANKGKRQGIRANVRSDGTITVDPHWKRTTQLSSRMSPKNS